MNSPGNVRAAARHLFALALRLSGCLWWAERQIQRKGGLVVLTFHRVLTNEESAATNSLPGMLVSRDCFRQLLGHVKRHYEITRLSDATPGRHASKVGLVLTFDDGWRDNFTNAAPEALEAGCPFSVMICPGLIGVDAPFWPERAVGALRRRHQGCSDAFLHERLEQLKRMTASEREAWFAEMRQGSNAVDPEGSCGSTLNWSEIASLKAQGIEFGAHTQTHQILDAIEPATAAAEVAESKRSIERELQTECRSFAYPNGNVTPGIRAIVAANGFSVALTTAPGVWHKDTDRFEVPRVNMSESNVTGADGRFSPTMFRYKVTWRAWLASRRPKVKSGATELAAESV